MAVRYTKHNQPSPAAKRLVAAPQGGSPLETALAMLAHDAAENSKETSELVQSALALTLALEFDSVFATVMRPHGAKRKRKAAPSLRVFVVLGDSGRVTFNQNAAAMLAAEPVPAEAVKQWFVATGLERRKDLFQALHLHPSTLSRAGPETEMDASVTERMLRHSDLLVRAAEVFGEDGKTWLTKPHDLLGGKTPMEFAGNEFGGAKVRAMINAIEYGGVV